MTPTIPFDVWYEDVEYLLDLIKKCNFDVIDCAGSYGYGETNITLVKEGLYSFKCTRNAFHYNKPAPTSPPATTQVAVGKTVGIYQKASGFSSVIGTQQDQILYYQVELLCTNDRLIKITVSEKWNSNYATFTSLDTDGLKNVHTVIFHDEEVLANGEWFKYDSPDAFIKDVGEVDISILCMIDVYERFNNER